MEGNNVFYINNKEYIYNGQDFFFYYETLEIFTYARDVVLTMGKIHP